MTLSHRILYGGLLALVVQFQVQAVDNSGYLELPEPLRSVSRATPNPALMLDPTGQTALLVHQTRYPSIERVAEPYLKLAGVRIEPRTHSRHDRSNGYGIRTCIDGFALLDIASGQQTPVTTPEGACLGAPQWSPDGTRFAFNITATQGVTLWVGEAGSGQTRRIEGVHLNTILGDSVQWLGDRPALLVKRIPDTLAPAAPARASVPPGPDIKQTQAGSGESSTYEARDTLESPEDERLFDYYATSQLAVVDLAADTVRDIGAPAVYAEVDSAPDGIHVRVESLKRPYSYVTTWGRFAHDVDVWNLDSGDIKPIASLPVADQVPVRGVPTGPRSFSWRANQPAALVWAEAQDGGDWRNNASIRDVVKTLAAPFTAEPFTIARLKQRYAGLAWFETGSQVLIAEYDANRQWQTTSLIDVNWPNRAPQVLWDHSSNERYRNPGAPTSRRLPNGAVVLREDEGALLLTGPGSSPQGDRPFVDRYHLATGSRERLFRSDADVYEVLIGFAAGDPRRLLTWRQSPIDPPNLYLRALGPAQAADEGEAVYASTPTPITRFPDPTPEVRQIRKQLVNYTRADGVELSFTLYTPPGYQEGTRLPAVLYAYPNDYADPAQAGQVTGSQKTFTQLSGYRLLLLAGYAIIDNAAFPIVGDPKTAYDTYIEQLVMNAEAAVNKAVDMGVVDRERIGVTGHSHGALMTANLLVHTDLFRAGVASSGGYNKTLTPFGFQNERRSFWAAPGVYDRASAFFHADKINEPLLIVHGSDDANPGTEPTQSPRLFQAIRGNGGTAKLVMLPFEPHWFTARESNEHFITEMLQWFDRYVKQAP